MKYYKIFIITIILFLIPAIAQGVEKDEIIVEALTMTGANIQRCDIIDWSLINNEFMDFDSMEQKSHEILKNLDIPKENLIATKEYDKMYRILLTEGLSDSGDFIQIILSSLDLQEYKNRSQTYLTINISSNNPEKIAPFSSKIRQAIVLSGGKSKITSCVAGNINGKLDRVHKNKIIDILTEYLEIDNIRKVEDENYYSILGESPYLSQGIKILNKNYNIDIAIRYNWENDTTYIYLGTPIISTDY